MFGCFKPPRERARPGTPRELLKPTGQSLNILVSGKVGAGKSSLIQSIAGEGIKSGKQESTDGITPYDTDFQVYTKGDQQTLTKTNPAIVTLWDTPGLGDVFSTEDTLTNVVNKCKEADLLVYCLDMRQRLSRDDVNAITRLTKELGPEFWKNAIFALTFANEVKPPPDSGHNPCKFFNETFLSWKDTICQLLRDDKLSVPEEGIAITTTGCHDPTDRKAWLGLFLKKAIPRAKWFKKVARKQIYVEYS